VKGLKFKPDRAAETLGVWLTTEIRVPFRRRFRLGTITGSKDPSRSRGTSISTGPISVSTVFDLVPLRMLAATGVWRCS
jgi:hypothetical protein